MNDNEYFINSLLFPQLSSFAYYSNLNLFDQLFILVFQHHLLIIVLFLFIQFILLLIYVFFQYLFNTVDQLLILGVGFKWIIQSRVFITKLDELTNIIHLLMMELIQI